MVHIESTPIVCQSLFYTNQRKTPVTHLPQLREIQHPDTWEKITKLFLKQETLLYVHVYTYMCKFRIYICMYTYMKVTYTLYTKLFIIFPSMMIVLKLS